MIYLKQKKMKTITKILILSLLVILSACGTRKAAIEKLKVNVTTKEQSKLTIDSSEKLTAKVEEKTETKTKFENNIKQKDVKTEVREVFKDGQLVEKTTTTTTSDKADNSKSETSEKKSKDESSIKDALKKIEKNAGKIVDSMIKSNAKEIDANNTIVKNFGGWAVMVLIALVIVGSVWYWLKNKH